MAKFSEAWPGLIDIEKGYVSDPDDPGGETKYGISKRSYPHVDIPNLTIPEALAIYEKDFWNVNRLSEVLDQALSNEMFEMLVNTSQSATWRCVQRAINHCGGGVYVDGKVGNKTLGWLPGNLNPKWLLDRFRVEAVIHYAELPNNKKYLKGWVLRVTR